MIAEPVSCDDHQPAELVLGARAVDRQLGLDEERRAVDVDAVDRDRAPGVSGTPCAPGRLGVDVEPGDAEEHERLVGAAHLLGLVGILRHPLADAVHRHFLARDEVALDQDAPDRRVGMAVVGVVVDPQHRAVFEAHARRALDLDGHRLPVILEPGDLEPLAVERAVLDRAAIEIGLDLLLGVEAADAAPGWGSAAFGAFLPPTSISRGRR